MLCGRENFEQGRQIFKFRFYSLGKWVTVEVDDKLPTKIYERKSEDLFQKKIEKFWSKIAANACRFGLHPRG